MSYQTIIFQKEEKIAKLILNRPEVLNALTDQMVQEIKDAVDDVHKDENIRVLIITGTGRAFCTGADVSMMTGLSNEPIPFVDTHIGRQMDKRSSMMTAPLPIWNMDKPVIAALNGVVAGMAVSVALACDIRIGTENTRFSMAFVKRGLGPDNGASYLLPRFVGPGMACKLTFTGDMIGADEAFRIGLIDELVPQDNLMNAANELAIKIAQNPPLTVRMAKRALYRGMTETDLETQMHYEGYVNDALIDTEDFKEGVNSFMEKRPGRFNGR